MANITLSQIWTSFSNLKRDVSDVPVQTFIEWCNFIAIEVYHTLSLGCEPERFLKSKSYSAITGSQILPTDFDSIKYEGCGFYELNGDGSQSDRKLKMTNFGSQERGFYLTDTTVYFTGLPDSVSVTLKYVPEITQFDSLSDYFTLGATATDPQLVSIDHMEVITLGLDMFYCRWAEDIDLEPSATQKYEYALMSLASDYRRSPDAHSILDFSSIY